MVWTCDADGSKKIIHIKMEEEPRRRFRTRWIDPIRMDIEMSGRIGKKYKKTRSRRIEMAGDLSVIVES